MRILLPDDCCNNELTDLLSSGERSFIASALRLQGTTKARHGLPLCCYTKHCLAIGSCRSKHVQRSLTLVAERNTSQIWTGNCKICCSSHIQAQGSQDPGRFGKQSLWCTCHTFRPMPNTTVATCRGYGLDERIPKFRCLLGSLELPVFHGLGCHSSAFPERSFLQWH